MNTAAIKVTVPVQKPFFFEATSTAELQKQVVICLEDHPDYEVASIQGSCAGSPYYGISRYLCTLLLKLKEPQPAAS